MRPTILKKSASKVMGAVLMALIWSWLPLANGCKSASEQGANASQQTTGAAKAEGPLVVYSGRSESLVGPLFAQFERETGIQLSVRYGDSAALAALLLEEGAKSPATAFFAQDVGAAGALAKRGALAKLPEKVLALVPRAFRAEGETWVGITGRARCLVYNPNKLAETDLPQSVDELTDPKWKGRLAWAPQNGSFQVFVTGLRRMKGEGAAEAWLRGMKANEPREYPKNGPIVQAVASGEADLGLVNHYYLLQMQKDNPNLAARNHFLRRGDAGSLVNVSALAVLASAPAAQAERAHKLAEFLLSEAAQKQFASDTLEYPLLPHLGGPAGVASLDALWQGGIDLGALDDLEGTLALLRKTGVLP